MKLVIWDLDDTLWEGTIFHGDKVTLKPETKEVLKQLDKLGVIQVVCSYNRLEPCIEQISEFGLTKYLTQISATTEETKDVIIKKYLEEFKVLPEETLFIDDSVLNRERVKMSVGCHVDYDTDLYQMMKYFDTERLVLMNQQRNRLNAENNWSGSNKEFLKIIGNEIRISLGEEFEIPRLANLANRTNELNASRNRYSEAEIETFIKDENYRVFVSYLKDKFGDYGLIGEVIIEIKEDEWFIKDVCVSCRTMGRGVASSMFETVIKEFKKNNVKKLTGVVVPNEDNFRMTRLFEKFGFKAIKEFGEEVNPPIYYEIKK